MLDMPETKLGPSSVSLEGTAVQPCVLSLFIFTHSARFRTVELDTLKNMPSMMLI